MSGLIFLAALASTVGAAYPSGEESAAEMRSRAYGMKLAMIHGVLMTIAFAFMYPVGSGLIRLLKVKHIAWIHGGWQIVAICATLAGLGPGVYVAKKRGMMDNYHPVIGLLVIAVFLLQPVSGSIAHYLRKHRGNRNVLGISHAWAGRLTVTLGAINGGLGFRLTERNERWIIAYSIIAAVSVVFWWSISIFDYFKNRRVAATPRVSSTSPSEQSESDVEKQEVVVRNDSNKD